MNVVACAYYVDTCGEAVGVYAGTADAVNLGTGGSDDVVAAHEDGPVSLNVFNGYRLLELEGIELKFGSVGALGLIVGDECYEVLGGSVAGKSRLNLL